MGLFKDLWDAPVFILTVVNLRLLSYFLTRFQNGDTKIIYRRW